MEDNEKLQEDIQKAVEALPSLVQGLAEMLNPIFEAAWETIKKVSEIILISYPNKKVLHLAIHHPSRRVRKKNARRIMRWIEKGK